MLQVSVQGLDRLLIRLVSLDVLIELLHVCIKAGRAECLLREPRRAYGGKCEQHFSHGDGEPADQRKPRTSGPRPKKACRMEEREKGRKDQWRGAAFGQTGRNSVLTASQKGKDPSKSYPLPTVPQRGAAQGCKGQNTQGHNDFCVAEQGR